MKHMLLICLLFIPLVSYAQIVGGTKGLGLDKSNTIIQEEQNYSCTPIPINKPPAQMKGSEGVPPLPLPAVPLRRTEKNNPPQPPVLIGKIDSGNTSDWNTNPADIDNLLKDIAREMNVHFSWTIIKLEKLAGNKLQADKE